ncbi:heparin lyase I family protein [Metabacillus sp. Hm71]|uniref:heparin lyase I family protein n=1 Tax=Metabacillus sp. Hm71 TaxID=3450743 RepID=UPI003F437AED
MKYLEVYIEETTEHYILVVKHKLGGSFVELDLLSDESSGYLDLYTNDTFTYTPTGKLIKPQNYNVRSTNITGSGTNQWAKIATVKINTAATNYSAMLAMFETEAIQATSSIRTFSIQIRQLNLNEAPRINVVELSSPTENRFEVYTVYSYTTSETTIDIWVKLLPQYCAIGYQVLTEMFNDGTKAVSAQYYTTPSLTSVQPTGTLKKAIVGVDQRIVDSREDARGFAVTAASNEAPIICIAKRTSVQTIPDQTAGGNTEVLWNTEDIDSDGMHVNTGTDSAKMTIKKEGIYRLETSINWAGVNAGIREVLIYKNGAALDRTTTAVAQSSNVTSQVVVTDIANVGDYYTVRVRQTSGANLDIQTSISKFTALRIGTAIGPRGGIKFESSFAYRGTSMYPNTILPERVFIQSDPVRGTSRQVAKFHTRSIDNEVLYPRVQLATNSILASGDEFYVGFGVYVPEDFVVVNGSDNDVMLHEIYGPPFNGGAPNSLRIFDNNFAIFPDVDNYPTPQWTMPLVKGKWVDFVFRYKLSTDPTIGYVEMSVNTGNGFESQLINGLQRYYHATLKAGVNDGGNNYSTIKVAYDAQSIRDEVIVLFANHRIGYDTFNSVDPGSYA